MWRILPFLVVACSVDEDPCESVEGYPEAYDIGYTDGATCAGYSNPHDSKDDPDPPADTGVATVDETAVDPTPEYCLWSAYDEGFSAGRSGADCEAGFD